MRDLVFIALIVGFFFVAALVVAACDRIVGPDPVDVKSGGPMAATEGELASR